MWWSPPTRWWWYSSSRCSSCPLPTTGSSLSCGGPPRTWRSSPTRGVRRWSRPSSWLRTPSGRTRGSPSVVVSWHDLMTLSCLLNRRRTWLGCWQSEVRHVSRSQDVQDQPEQEADYQDASRHHRGVHHLLVSEVCWRIVIKKWRIIFRFIINVIRWISELFNFNFHQSFYYCSRVARLLPAINVMLNPIIYM